MPDTLDAVCKPRFYLVDRGLRHRQGVLVYCQTISQTI
jgi:hypothetical protein